jgi:predicted dehydrogenase
VLNHRGAAVAAMTIPFIERSTCPSIPRSPPRARRSAAARRGCRRCSAASRSRAGPSRRPQRRVRAGNERGAAEPGGELAQRWPEPSRPRPIVLVGAGGIVNDAHLPAYRAAGFPVAGCFDVDPGRAQETARRWGLAHAFASLADAARVEHAVFDVAVPPAAVHGVVAELPEGAVALIQKPLGEDLADATRIRALCRAKRITAAVNFQLRFSPMMLALRDAIDRGWLGRVVELEVHVNCRMPWELWPFMESLRRMEIALHSIHYLDFIRSIWAIRARCSRARCAIRPRPGSPARAPARSSTTATTCAAACRSTTTTRSVPRHQSSAMRSRASAARRSSRWASISTIRRAGRTRWSSPSGRRLGDDWTAVRCAATGSPTRSTGR